MDLFVSMIENGKVRVCVVVEVKAVSMQKGEK